MSTQFLNGVETIREKTGPTPIMGVDTAIIGLIGTAPIFDVEPKNRKVNEAKLVTNERDGVINFGYDYSEYTIPAALKAIYAQGGAKVIVINVFDPAKHKSSFSGEKQIEKTTVELTERGVANLEITGAQLDKDYTFDGKTITVKSDGTLNDAQSITLSYDYADPTKVAIADIVGGLDIDGNRFGIKVLEIAKAQTGYKPKIIIAPGFTSAKSVTAAIKPIAQKLKAVYYLDPESGASQDDVIKQRGTQGTGSFNTQDLRANLFFPTFIANANYDGAELELPPSAVWAGIRAKVDAEHGPHYSSGNQPINGVKGVSKFVSWELNDPSTDSNLLNAQGINVAVNVGELRTWGNRNASFPQNADIDSFECTVRIADYIEDSIEFATLNKMAGPIDQSMIDDIISMITSLLNNLKGPNKRWIIDGRCWYDKALNPATELAMGHLVIPYEFLNPPPFERGTYRSRINIQLFDNLGGS